jgi:hypothetical protein
MRLFMDTIITGATFLNTLFQQIYMINYNTHKWYIIIYPLHIYKKTKI